LDRHGIFTQIPLDPLWRNATTAWNEGNFKIASVHLLGAAVDNEEVSMSPRDISDDKTNWGTPKSDYGEAIQEEVVDFYNLYSPKDNALEPYPAPYFGIYPSFEGDQALGQSGKQTKLTAITLPENYNETNVESQLPENCSIENSDINMTDADGDGDCDLDFYDPLLHDKKRIPKMEKKSTMESRQARFHLNFQRYFSMIFSVINSVLYLYTYYFEQR
jgi:hypothetical protein